MFLAYSVWFLYIFKKSGHKYIASVLFLRFLNKNINRQKLHHYLKKRECVNKIVEISITIFVCAIDTQTEYNNGVQRSCESEGVEGLEALPYYDSNSFNMSAFSVPK